LRHGVVTLYVSSALLFGFVLQTIIMYLIFVRLNVRSGRITGKKSLDPVLSCAIFVTESISRTK